MTDHVQRFLERFADFGAAPDPDKYERLFDPHEGTVLHPGMPTPLRREQVRACGDRVPLLARLMPAVTLAEAAELGAPAPGLDVGMD